MKSWFEDEDRSKLRWLLEYDGIFYKKEISEDAMNKNSAQIPNKLSVPEIKEVIFNEEGNATIILWEDGDKTVVHCGEGERFDRYTGFMACIAKKMFGGTTTAKKLMNKLDKKYQAKLKAEKEAERKAKREEEAKEAQAKAEKRRLKEETLLKEALVEYFLREAEAKLRAEEILAARDSSSLKIPFDEGEKHE